MDHGLLSGLVTAASLGGLGGIALIVASAFVRQRSPRRGVYFFALGVFVMTGFNTLGQWFDSLRDSAEWQAKLGTLSAAEQASPPGQELLRWVAEKAAEPPVEIYQWVLLLVATLLALVGLLRPEWVMLPQDRVRLGLPPTLGPRIGGTA